MANIPTPRSYNEILGDMIDAFLSRFGLPALKTGTPILSTLEAAAQSQLRSSEDIFTLLDAQSLDQAEGIALDNIGADESLPRITESPATGLVTISDSSFTKISSKVFQGTAAPIIGSTKINVPDASLFPASGSIYIGRGTDNYEGPLAYTSILPPGSGGGMSGGAYYTFVLSSGTLRFHNTGEPVILAQGGNRDIAAGTNVQTPQGNSVVAIQFKTIFLVTIPDGETSIQNVQVIALKSGIVGNVAAGAISQFSGTGPFTGSSVVNPLPFTNGLPSEDDDSYRERIRAARQSRSRGTPLALETASVGVVASDENKRVLSASVVSQSGQPTVLYIDDGTGYEERDEGIAIESITDSADGGETFFKISATRPVAKAFVLSSFTAPFALNAGDTLAVLVGGVITEHTFNADEFLSIGNASAYEVAASINGNPALLWSARTYNNATQVAVFAKADSNESVEVTVPSGHDANLALGFSTTRVDTMRLYKNDRLLSKDGALASIESNPTSFWSGLSGTQTLVIDVDGNTLSFDGTQFAAFSGQDFIDADTGFTTLGPNTLAAWAAVFTKRIPGVTVEPVAGKLVLTSNRGRTATASIAIVSGTLVANGMFDVVSAVGANNDYTLDRNTGEIRLESALFAGDRLAAGSTQTRAFLQSDPISLLNLSTSVLWFAVDASATRVLSGLTASTPISFSIGNGEVHTWGCRVRITSTTSSALFANVEAGDWAVFWDPASPVGTAEYLVSFVDTNDKFFEIDMKQCMTGRYGHRVTQLNDGTFLITGGTIGATEFDPGSNADSINQVSNTAEIYNPTTGAFTSIPSMAYPRVFHTATKLNDGRVLVVGGYQDYDLVDVVADINGTCEIFDPTTKTWSSAATMPHAVGQHEAVLLNSGNVLIAGGVDAVGTPDNVIALAYIYTPGTNTWASTGSLNHARRNFTMALFSTSGNVMVAGGDNGTTVLASLERFTGAAWANIGNLNGGARRHLTSVATSGTVVYIAGGSSTLSSLQDTPVVFTETYTDGGAITADTSMNHARARHGMTLLNSGKIVVFGGIATPSAGTGAPESYTGGVWTNLAFPLSAANATSGGNRYGVKVRTVPGTDDFFIVGGQAEKDWPWNFSSIETHLSVGDTWIVRNPILTGSVSFGSAGLQFVRSQAPLQRVAIPVATNYTAASLSSVIQPLLVGATTSVYRTTSLRVRTNTFNDVANLQEQILSGDIGLVAETSEAASITLPLADATVNITGHMASLESGNYEYGTPDFHQAVVLASTGTSEVEIGWSLNTLNTALLDQASWNRMAGNMFVGLRAFNDSPNNTAVTDAVSQARIGGIQNFISSLADIRTNFTSMGTFFNPNGDILDLRQSHTMGFLPIDRFYFGAPYQLGYDDQITVLVDGDVEQKRFTLPMWRTLKTVGGTYGTTNTFKDADNAGLTLATAFGYTGGPLAPFDFDDFAVFMPARCITSTDSTLQSILWRYYRLGPDGNAGRVRFIYPTAPNSALSIVTEPGLAEYATEYPEIGIDIVLGSGALRTGYGINALTVIGEVRPSLTIGTNLAQVYYIFAYPIASATRTGGTTVTLTLTLPSGVTNHGLSSGQTYHVVSTSGSFTTGDFVLTGTTPTTVTYTDAGANVTVSNIGQIYLGAGLTGNISGASVAQDDFFYLGTAASTDSSYEGFTTRIINDPVANPYWIEGRQQFITAPALTTTPTLYTLGDATQFQIFTNLKQTALQIVTAANLLVGAPMTGTNLDAGSGAIYKSTADMMTDSTFLDAMTDGYNFIKTTTPAGSSVADYQLTFKVAVNAALVSADWAHETVKIVPRTAKNIVDWLSASGVSGLFTSALIEQSSRGHKVQISSLTAGSGGSIQIQGGTANSATAPIVGSATIVGTGSYTTMYSQIAAADVQGLFTGQFVAINNSVVLPKVSIFQAGTQLDYVKLINQTAEYLQSTAVATQRTTTVDAVVRIERQGRFMCITGTPYGTNDLDSSNVVEGDWVRIYTSPGTALANNVDALNSLNAGIFRVVRVVKNYNLASDVYDAVDGGISTSFWIENANGIDQHWANVAVTFYSADSMMPGDSVVISSDYWGTGNRGAWTVKSVGSASSTVPVAGLVRSAGTVTVSLPNTSPIYKHSLAMNDWFTLSPGESGFPAGNYQVASVIDAWTFTYTNAGANTTSAGIQSIIGFPFQNLKVFALDNSTQVSQQISSTILGLGSLAPLFQDYEATPGRYIKQIQAISPNVLAPTTLADIKFNTSARSSQIGEAAGSILSVLDKIDFPTSLAQGLDGYKHAIGLIGEVNKVIYGDPNDPATYPGVAAAGATVNIQGPLVKRIVVSLGVRIRSGAPKADIEARVKSAVAAVVNAAGVGESIAISSIIDAASKVTGVVAITPINPVLSSGNDLIVVQAYEKPLVISLDTDVQVSFVGD